MMSLSEFDEKRCKLLLDKFIDSRRPPKEVRDQVDLHYQIENQSVEIFEIRALWDNPNKKQKEPVAKATYIKRSKVWKIYWMRADLRWHTYEPCPQVSRIEEFIDIVNADEYHCFWG